MSNKSSFPGDNLVSSVQILSAVKSNNCIVGKNDNLLENLDKESLLKILECPVCLEIPSTAIILCANGHSICQKCRNKVGLCPVCKGAFMQVRNFLAEQLVEKIISKCQYFSEGCPQMVNPRDWNNHLISCDFRPILCNSRRSKHCTNVKVSFSNYLSHLVRVHHATGYKGDVFKTSYSYQIEQAPLDRALSWNSCPIRYFEAYNEVFLGGVSIVPGKIYWWIYILGSGEAAENFIGKITIQMKNPEKSKMQLNWQGPIHSIRVSPDSILEQGLCLLATKETLLPFTSTNANSPNEIEWNMIFSVVKPQDLIFK